MERSSRLTWLLNFESLKALLEINLKTFVTLFRDIIERDSLQAPYLDRPIELFVIAVLQDDRCHPQHLQEGVLRNRYFFLLECTIQLKLD
jgi:hypothetical protein